MRRVANGLALGLLFTIPWEAAVLVSGLGTVTKVIGFALILAWGAEQLVSGRFLPLRRFHIWMFMFFLWSGVTLLWASNQAGAAGQIWTYAQLGIMVIVLWDLLQTEVALRQALQVFVLGCYVAVGSTFYNFIQIEEQFSIREIRVAATGFNPNQMATILVLAMPIAWMLASTTTIRDARGLSALNYAFIPLAGMAIALSGSRTGFLAAIPVVAFLVSRALRSSPGKRVAFVVIAVAAVFLLQAVVPESQLERLGTTSSEISSRDFNGRFTAWVDGLEAFIEDPLLGVGLSSFEDVSSTGIGAHNMFIQIAVETGIIGLLLFLGVVGSAFVAAARLKRSDSGLWLTLLSAWVIAGLANSWQYQKFTWVVLGFIVSAAHVGTHDTISRAYVRSR